MSNTKNHGSSGSTLAALVDMFVYDPVAGAIVVAAAILYLIIGGVLVGVQIHFSGWPTGYANWTSIVLTAVFAPTHFVLLLLKFANLLSGEKTIINGATILIAVWLLCPAVPVLINTLNLGGLLFQYRYLANAPAVIFPSFIALAILWIEIRPLPSQPQ
jgi:hypothetical protein